MRDMPTPCEICGDIVDFQDMRQCAECDRWMGKCCSGYEDPYVCIDCEEFWGGRVDDDREY